MRFLFQSNAEWAVIMSTWDMCEGANEGKCESKIEHKNKSIRIHNA